MLYSDLKDKDVINMKTCKKIGKVCDLEFDVCTGQICKLMIQDHCGWNNFFCCEPEYILCYQDVKQIGPDIILVEI